MQILERNQIHFCEPDTLIILDKVIHSLSTFMFIPDNLYIILKGNNTNENLILNPKTDFA